MKNFAAIVLAAGKGTRMNSEKPKVLHPVAGKPMLYYPLELLSRLGVKKTVVVVGHGADEVQEAFKSDSGKNQKKNSQSGLGKVCFTLQSPQLGTGHAVMQALKELKGFSGDILILSGDVPLLRMETIRALLKSHNAGKGNKKPVLSFVSLELNNPSGYGRVIRDAKGDIQRIVEDKDLKPSERGEMEVNAGIYLINAKFLQKNIKKLKTNNKQGEYYLPELIRVAVSAGDKVGVLRRAMCSDTSEVMGVNNRLELATANAIMQERVLTNLLMKGVTLLDPSTTYIDYGVKVGRDTVLAPNVYLYGDTTVASGAIIEEGVKLINTRLERGAHIKSSSVLEDSLVGKDATVGPFARLRPGTVIGSGAHIGNFVELKNAVIGKGSKAGHLSYLGDCTIGKNVNIGAGVITCNYDGKKKHKTIIKDNAFIGSDTQLVAPVTVGKGAYIGSGSTITKNVTAGALALTRAEQRSVSGWALKRERLNKLAEEKFAKAKLAKAKLAKGKITRQPKKKKKRS
jgi:bifunctional UDP-N-acetylglucosamine pyrophosphorylase/glucosamine-1-phosphate N-acetyltransferase